MIFNRLNYDIKKYIFAPSKNAKSVFMTKSYTLFRQFIFSFLLLCLSYSAFAGSLNYPGGPTITYDACNGSINITTGGEGFYYTCTGENDSYNLQYARFSYQNASGAWIEFFSIWSDADKSYAEGSSPSYYPGNSGGVINTSCGSGSTQLGDGYFSRGYYFQNFPVGTSDGTNYFSNTNTAQTTCFYADQYNESGSNCCGGCGGNGEGFTQNFYYSFRGLPPSILASGSVNIKVEGSVWQGGTDISGSDRAFPFSQTTTLTIPSINPPTNLSATNDLCGKVNLTWANPTQTFVAANSCVAGNMVYNTIIYRGLSASSLAPIAQVNGDSTSYFDNTVSPNTTYTYKIQTIWWNNGGYTYAASPLSALATGNPKPSPPQPVGFSATNNLCNSTINLNWTYNYDSPRLFNISRGTTSVNGPFTFLDTVSSNQSFFADTSKITRGINYYYVITAEDGCYDNSSQSHATGISPADPSLPSNLRLTVDNVNNQFILHWKDNASNATQYNVERQDENGNLVTFQLGQYDTTYTDNTVSSCRAYTYDIRVIAGCTPAGLRSATTVTGTLPPPNLSSTFSTTQKLIASKGYFTSNVQLSWSNSNDNVLSQMHLYRQILGSSTPAVEITSLTPGTTFYVDNTVDAGVFYQYYLVGEAVCNGVSLYSDTTYDVGFRSPTALVNGQVTYSGGIAVKGVELNIETTSGNTGYSAAFTGSNAVSVPSSASISPSSAVSVEAWVNFTSLGSSDQVLFSKPGSYELFYQGSTGNLVMQVSNGGSSYSATVQASAKIAAASYAHLAGVYDGTSVKLFVNGVLADSVKGPSAITSNTNTLTIGNLPGLNSGFSGDLKEIRVWNTVRNNADVQLDYNRVLNGNETGMALLYHTNEDAGTSLYDISKTGSNYNMNNGAYTSNPSWSSNIPTISQLGYIAYTDSTGSYTVEGILYAGSGENYKVIPAFGVHSFNPPNTVLFLGDGSAVQNGINFTDKSSFNVQGYLNYDTAMFKHCTCAVEGATLNIDGSAVVSAGSLVQTDVNGHFSIQVPIGEHFITVTQNGHAYSAGRFPPTGTYDFENTVSGLQFYDTTSVKVIGRVVGGLREANKPMVLGLSKNNIGSATIAFHTQSGCYSYTVTTNDTSGDYVVHLPPFNYTIDNLSIKSNPSSLAWPEFQNNALLSISNILPVQEEKDSVFKTVTIQSKQFVKDSIYVQNGKNVNDSIFTYSPVTKKILLSVDSTSYQKILSWTHRSAPSLWVHDYLGRDYKKHAGDSTFTYTNPAGVQQSLSITDSTFGYPIYTQGSQYSMTLGAIETYTNYDKARKPFTIYDSVPVTSGVFTINNAISSIPGPISIAQDSTVNEGVLSSYVSSNLDTAYISYSFQGGYPNIVYNGGSQLRYNFLQQLSINFQTGSNPPVDWLPVSGGTPLQGIVLGGIASGGQGFVSVGPQVPEFILRDPPGTNSYSSLEVGSSITHVDGWSNEGNIDISASHTVDLGASVTTGVGVATTSSTKNEIDLDADVGIDFGKEGEDEVTVTATQAWKTDDAPSHVGSMADVYVGRAMNLNFGVGQNIAIVPSALLKGIPGIDSSEFGFVNGQRFTIIKRSSLVVNPQGYSTAFFYTQDFIVNTLIPNLTTLRNQLFANEPTKYISNIKNPSDPNYGTNNDDPVWGSKASSTTPYITNPSDSTGPSYTFHAGKDSITIKVVPTTGGPSVTQTMAPESCDSIRWYNQQIRLWKQAVFMNEMDKYKALQDPSRLIQNVSFSDGVEYENSVETESVNTDKWTFEVNVSGTAKLNLGVNVAGAGVETSAGLTLGYTHGHDSTDVTKNSTKWGYTLSDQGAGDYLSTDIRNGYYGFGPIFHVTGGQTRCPYEGADSSIYYSLKNYTQHDSVNFDLTPHVLLNNATLQTENVLAKIDGNLKFSEKDNLPSGSQAVYDLEIDNLTQSVPALTVSYAITVLTQTNPYGASLTIDGLDPSTQLYPVAGGSSLHQQIILTQGATQYNYDSIAVVVHSACSDAQVADTVYLTAHFLPACSPVTLSAPLNQWVVNSSFNDTLNTVISGYNINYPGLQTIVFEYKPSSVATWVPLYTWYKDSLGRADGIPQNAATISYPWSLLQLPDNNYDIRAMATCLSQVGPQKETSESVSEVFSGVVDRINPAPFGTPSPTTGILEPGQDISITFNKDLDGGILSNQNFDIRGVLNGTTVEHSTSLNFNGTDAYASVIGGANLQTRNFTFEFWANRTQGGEMAVISQSPDSTQSLFIGFNAANQLTLRFGAVQISGDKAACPTDGEWHHYAITYLDSSQTVAMYADFYGSGTTPMNTNSFMKPFYNGAGIFYFGKDAARNYGYYNGLLQEVRLWNTVLSGPDIASQQNTILNSNTGNLLYDWRMDEAAGTIAEDYIRSRNATLYNTTWQITPNGYACNFNAGSDGYVKVNTSKVAITNQMDFTLEFWFNSTQSGVATLFSNGKGDGLGSDSLIAWNIEKDANGLIHVKNDKIDFVATKANYFDGNWHHFALVMKRSSSLSCYIDGNPENSIASGSFQQWGGAAMFAGARGYMNGSTLTIDQYFNGSIDEVRFWNTARLIQQITRDKQNRLLGNEPGLQVYLPFESYKVVLGVPVLTASIQDYSQNNQITSNSAGATTTASTPTIKLPRPIQEVDFTYELNGDEIILTSTMPPADIENVTLDITVQNVQDLVGNSMQSPATWIAYVNQNQVVWQDAGITLSKKLDASLTFTGTIVNSGGALKSYTIGNLPSWLSVSQSTGDIAPNSTQIVTFTISPEVNIGNYTQDITLTTDFDFPEKYTLSLNVFAPAPAWNVNSSNYQYSEGLIGQLQIDGVVSADTSDIVAAFHGSSCVGVSKLKYYQQYDKYYAVMDLFSNNPSGDTLTFNIWSAAEGKQYSQVTPTVYFKADTVIGTFINPILLQTTDLLTQTIPLNAGWNWISAGVLCPDSNYLNGFLASIRPQNGIIIKGQSSYADYSSQYGWTGSLANPLAGIKVQSSYRLNVLQIDTLVFSGSQIDPTTKPITLVPGWNWVGFISLRNQTVTAALGNLNPTQNDIIKGQNSFAIYDSTLGWAGSLTYMQPNAGYMIKSAKGGTFTYPINGISGAKLRNSSYLRSNSLSTIWQVQQSSVYANNMNVIATVNCDELSNSNLELGCFSKGICKGVAPLYRGAGINGVFFLTAFSDSASEQMDLKLLDENTGNVYAVQNSLGFVPDALLGTIEQPVALNLNPNDLNNLCSNHATSAKTTVVTKNTLMVDPSPFVDQFTLNTTVNYQGKAHYIISSVLGKVVAEGDIITEVGLNTNVFSAKLLNMTSGVYFIEVTTPNDKMRTKVIKQ